MYLIMLPYLTYKIIFHENISHNKIPSLGIFVTPANLYLVGFLTVFVSINDGQISIIDGYNQQFILTIVIILTILSISTTLFSYMSFYKIFKTKFNCAFASLTFPTAIGSIAILKVYKFSQAFQNQYGFTGVAETFRVIAYIEISIATIIIIGILFKFLTHIYKIHFISFFKKQFSIK